MSYSEAMEEKMKLVEKTQNQKSPIEENTSKKGGLKTLPFIIANEAFEKVASDGIQPNLILYLMNEYHYSSATGGIVQLWLTAMFPEMKPKPCDLCLYVCDSATPAQFIFLLSSLGLMSTGAGCIRPCSIAFAADQMAKRDDPAKKRRDFTDLLQLLLCYNWNFNFACLDSTGLFTGFAKVFVSAWTNRRLDLGLATQPINSDGVYYYSKDLKLVAPSNNLRFLNKACIARDPDEDLKPGGSPTKPWELCTVSQVETLKSLIRVIPIWSTGFMTYMALSQNSIPVLQAKTMDRHITTSFDIPAGSFALFTITTLTIWVAFYDRITALVLARYTGKPNGISATIRMGIGLLLSCISMAVARIVERIRRRNISTVTAAKEHVQHCSGIFHLSSQIRPEVAKLNSGILAFDEKKP
ncbi:hypothetical protein C5167_044402 [Papaver somniferum]|uniref:Uncharacterized protein n=1 Tax=Papaver somniferum TaxID=3469 RepID=A0A4Y7LAY1_PAPSO|nr:hypothetical protein C5167_044402 [Papaver somniferum]